MAGPNNEVKEEEVIIGEGSRRTISMSKTRKRTASKKNRREKGSRAEDLGSKPHSKGEDFSRSANLRREKMKAAKTTTVGRMSAIIEEARFDSII
jgi:hypothetical protein